MTASGRSVGLDARVAWSREVLRTMVELLCLSSQVSYE